MRNAGRWPAAWLGPLLLVMAVVAVPAPARGAVPAGPAARQLAERYAPVVMLRRYDAPCGATGEPFVPMTVDAVLGNPEVALRQVGNGDPVIKWAPTAHDLYGRGPGVYLDFAGDALRPGCVYATDSARYTPTDRSAVYAHVAQQSDRPGFLAVQYWLYWYYNDWNDKHESDWEFVQILFQASTVDEALTREPLSAGFAQHEGGEVAQWSSGKLERVDSHPVIYSSERSHASYVEPALFLGRGAAEGFGCDNTEPPSTRIQPRVVMLPDAPSGPDDPYAWLAFAGRWGERHAAPNDGPTGPAAKPAWDRPVSWQDGLRPDSFAIPGGSAAPTRIVGAFCAVVERGSVLFLNVVASPGAMFIILTLLALLFGFLVRRTSWRRVDPLPVVVRRRSGEIVRASLALYRDRPATLAATGLIAVPVAVVAVLVGLVLQRLPVVGPPAAGFVAAAFSALTVVLVGAAVAAVLEPARGLAGNGVPGAGAALRAVGRHAGDLAAGFVPAAVLVGVLTVTVVGAPVAVWLAVRYLFLPQTVMLDGLGGRPGLRHSGALVRRRWWHTVTVAVLVWAAVTVVAVAVGLLLLVTVTALPLWVVSAVAAACYIALLPLAAIVLTLLYGDARAALDQRRPSTREPEVVESHD
jgi:hypothetical protein